MTAAGEIVNIAAVTSSHLEDPDSVVGLDEVPDEDDEDAATLTVEATSGRVAEAEPEAGQGETSAAGTPEVVELGLNYPNPFNPQTVIPYGVPEATRVRLEVYDLLGRRVAVLVDGVVEAGRYEAPFRAERLPTGVYLVRMQAGVEVQTRRITLMK